MKRTRLTSIGLAIAALLVALPSALRPDSGRGAIPRLALDLDLGRVNVSEAGFGSGWTFAAGLSFRTGRRIGTEVMIERDNVPIETGAAGLPVAGRMSMATLLVNEKLYGLTRGRLLPYVLLGIGFTFPGYHPDNWPQGTPERVFVERLALQIGGGVDIRIVRGFALCAKARYNLVKTWMEDAGRTGPIRETDPLAQAMLHLYGLKLGLGLKISL